METKLQPFYVLALCFCLTSQGALAIDPRVRTEVYDARLVYTVYTGIGIATLIQLENDEGLEISPSSVLGIGDADAWNLGVRGNNIVLKPVTRMPKTNIVVVTNKRTYSFDLVPSGKKTPPTYIIRFAYPDTDAAIDEAEQARLILTMDAKALRRTVNTEYTWKGRESEAALAPTAAWDDGRFTRLTYNHAGELPVFYKVLPDGSEALLNYNVDSKDKATIVLHEVIRKARARLNNQVIEIYNRRFKVPMINETGAGAHGAVRIEKEGANDE